MFAAILLTAGFPATAVLTAQEHAHPRPEGPGWSWTLSSRAFLTANFQVRKFTDFRQVESQNWFMAEGARAAGRGRLMLHAMVSLEPVTLRRLGSAQVFQTGETLDSAPLIDYQHPHDFLMGLALRYERPIGERSTAWISVAPVGPAALGPAAFMHRASAEDHPTAPLTHHNIDSLHITRSVVSAGIAYRWLSFEASAFKGREPDENRFDLDAGVPDSWAARAGWTGGAWRAQISGGRLKSPDAIEPFLNMVRLTASVEYSGSVGGRLLAVTAAAGRNQEVYGNIDGALLEATWRVSPAQQIYARVEVVEKNILTAGGLHPPGFSHPHVFSTVGAVTAGYAHRVRHTRAGDFALGGDLTLHKVAANLQDSYGRSPWTVHLYLRWQGRRPAVGSQRSEAQGQR